MQPAPILLLILIIFISSVTVLCQSVDNNERRALQSTTSDTYGGGGNAPSVSTQGATTSVETTQPKNGGRGTRRRKGGHGKMKAEFLNAHNEVRTQHGQPPLRWNQTLERFAQQWAILRAKDCKLVHAPNNQYGENLFWGKYRHWTPKEVIKQWADEVAFYNKENFQCTEGQQCGHYTQIVWKSTAWVGCAKQVCFNGEVFVVCEYFPAGNYLDTPNPYTAKASYPGEENNIPQSVPSAINVSPSTTTATMQSEKDTAEGTSQNVTPHN